MEETNQLISHIELCTVSLESLESKTKPIKTKTKTMKMYPGVKKIFKSATGLDPNDFLAVYKFLSTGPHCENAKFYEDQVKQELKKHTRCKTRNEIGS